MYVQDNSSLNMFVFKKEQSYYRGAIDNLSKLRISLSETIKKCSPSGPLFPYLDWYSPVRILKKMLHAAQCLKRLTVGECGEVRVENG